MQIQVAKDARREGRRRSCRWQNQPFYLFSDVIRFNFKGPNISVNIFSTDLFPRFYSDCKLACLGDDELIHCMWRGLQKVGAITLKGTSLLHVHVELERGIFSSRKEAALTVWTHFLPPCPIFHAGLCPSEVKRCPFLFFLLPIIRCPRPFKERRRRRMLAVQFQRLPLTGKKVHWDLAWSERHLLLSLNMGKYSNLFFSPRPFALTKINPQWLAYSISAALLQNPLKEL